MLSVLCYNSEKPTYHCSLLFASCRPIIPRVYGPIVNFLRDVDTINNDIHHCSVDMATCLQLPLSALFMTSTCYFRSPSNNSWSTSNRPSASRVRHILHQSDHSSFSIPPIDSTFTTSHIQPTDYTTAPVQPALTPQLHPVQLPSVCPSFQLNIH